MVKKVPEVKPAAASNDSLVVLLVTLADTTWRMIVPTLGLAIVGLWADLRFGTGPWLTIVGTVTGLAFAVLLVKRQLEAVE